MAGDPRAGALCRVGRLAQRLGDVFVLVIEAGGDFVQAARFRPTFLEVRPGVELPTRRPAIAATGEFAPAVERHRLGLQPKPEAMDFASIGRRLRPSATRPRDSERCLSADEKPYCRIGSHWRVSVPHNSVQSSYVDG